MTPSSPIIQINEQNGMNQKKNKPHAYLQKVVEKYQNNT